MNSLQIDILQKRTILFIFSLQERLNLSLLLMMSDYRELAVWRIMSKNVDSWILVKNLWNISLFSYYCMPSSLMICTVSLLKNNIISSLWVLARLFTEDECNVLIYNKYKASQTNCMYNYCTYFLLITCIAKILMISKKYE